MAADFHVHEPLIWGGKWHSQYARPEQPFVLELGCGKGGFISLLASAHPENNYLGCLLYTSGVRLSVVCGGRALREAQAMRSRQADIGALLSAKADQTAVAVHQMCIRDRP